MIVAATHGAIGLDAHGNCGWGRRDEDENVEGWLLLTLQRAPFPLVGEGWGGG